MSQFKTIKADDKTDVVIIAPCTYHASVLDAVLYDVEVCTQLQCPTFPANRFPTDV